MPEADRGDAVDPQLLDDLVERGEEFVLGLGRSRALDAIGRCALAVDDPGGDLRPAHVDPDRALLWSRGYDSPPNGRREKSPTASTGADASRGGCRRSANPSAQPARTDREPRRFKGPGPKPQAPKRRAPNWRRWIGSASRVFVLLLVAWGVASYLAMRSGAKEANKRLPASAKAALVPQTA